MGAEIGHVGFLRYQRPVWISIGFLLIIAATALARFRPHGEWTQYELGGLAAVILLFLALLSVRKRSYRSRFGTVKAWVSAHVYLGMALVAVALIHAQFQMHANVHGLLLLLLLIATASGFWGLWAYDHYPNLITENRMGATREAWLAELADINDHCLTLADLLGPDFHRAIVRSVEGQHVGGSLHALLFGTLPPDNETMEILKRALRARGSPEIRRSETSLLFESERLPERGGDEAARLHRLVDLMAQRRQLLERINRDVQLHARMQIWLWLHVPTTAAVFAALVAHVVVVFWFV